MKQYEEYSVLPPPWGWIIIALLCLALIGWGLVNYGLVRDRPRQWDYGTLPEAPASSVFTEVEPAQQGAAPRQIEPLPGARPLKGQEAGQ